MHRSLVKRLSNWERASEEAQPDLYIYLCSKHIKYLLFTELKYYTVMHVSDHTVTHLLVGGQKDVDTTLKRRQS